MSLVAHGGVHVSQTSAEMRLFSENLHVVTSRSWYNFVETRHIGWSNGKLCSKLYIIMDSCVKKVRTNTSFSTANLSHSAFAESKPMETFHPDMSTYVKSCTRTRPRKSKWCRVISWSVVVVSRFSWSVSRLNRCVQLSWSFVLRGQSSWSSWSVVGVSHFFVVSQRSSWSSWSVDVVSRSSWMVLYSIVVMHTYLLRHMAGENRGQCLDKCTGACRTRVGGTKLDRNRSRMSIIT